MALFSNLRKTRLKKLQNIKDGGFDPYPAHTKRTHTINEALLDFERFSKTKEKIVLTGRIRSIREHGGSTFLHFEDGSASSPQGGTGKIQAYFKQDKLGEKKYKFFLGNFDIGDFIEVSGVLFETKKGEKTIEASDFRILAKSLLSLPEKWHGLKDVEERYRKRYLDLIFNPEVKKKFELRSRIIKKIRVFLEEEGFLEVETPILQPIYGGAKARPFKTHLNALNLDLYLRIAPELYLKRLLVGGFEKIYEIGKCFRNEGVDRHHNPDFTMLEFYWAYADYEKMMNFAEKMLGDLIKDIFGGLEIVYENKTLNFKTPWPRLAFGDFLKECTGVDLVKANSESLKKEAEKLGVEIKKGGDRAEIIDEIYKKYCRPKIWQPTILTNYPPSYFPLAKALEADQSKLANFQLVIAGWEIVNAFSELNDPIEQRIRFEEQEKLFKSGFEEAQRKDEDFLEALEYGMPPAAGFGMGIDRLAALLTNSHSLREIILFPTMRPK